MTKPVAPGTGVAHVNVNVVGKWVGQTGLTGHAEAQGVADGNVGICEAAAGLGGGLWIRNHYHLVLRAVFICLLRGAAKWYGGREIWILDIWVFENCVRCDCADLATGIDFNNDNAVMQISVQIMMMALRDVIHRLHGQVCT
jgi:hypothetical protein